MFIEIALRDLAPSTLILFRMGFGRGRARGLHQARPGAAAARCSAVRVAARPPRPRQHRRPVLPHRLGPAVHRLRARGDLQRLCPALHGALRSRVRPEPARDRNAARRRRRSASAASSCSSASRSRGGERAVAGGLAVVGAVSLLRARRPLRGPPLPGPAAAARRFRDARLGDALRAPVRGRAGELARLGGARSPCSTSASRRPASRTSSTSA